MGSSSIRRAAAHGWSSGMVRVVSGDEFKRGMELEAMARAAHEVNRAYCIAMDDKSQQPWEQAPEWQRQSAYKGVDGVLAGNGPKESHESWLREKEATGWKYGPVKDAELKEHPCMVPYADLPPRQKAKDALFVGTVLAMAQALGRLP
jgi:hypothetical protein